MFEYLFPNWPDPLHITIFTIFKFIIYSILSLIIIMHPKFKKYNYYIFLLPISSIIIFIFSIRENYVSEYFLIYNIVTFILLFIPSFYAIINIKYKFKIFILYIITFSSSIFILFILIGNLIS